MIVRRSGNLAKRCSYHFWIRELSIYPVHIIKLSIYCLVYVKLSINVTPETKPGSVSGARLVNYYSYKFRSACLRNKSEKTENFKHNS